MAVEAAASWYQELREVEYLQESTIKKMGSISRRLMMANDLSEAEVARLKEERRALREDVQRLALEMSPLPDFSGMTEAERAAAAEKLRNVEVNYALRLKQEGDSRGHAMEASARVVDFDPKQGGLYYSRYTRGDLTQFNLDEQSRIGPMRYIDSPYKKESDFLCLCTAVNFLTVKIASSDVGFPIRVYGTIIVRDSVDVRCVYHFRRHSDSCQLINSKFDSLILTGPKRGLALTGDIYVETDLKMEDDLVQDRELSKGLIIIRNSSTGPSPLMTGYMFQTKSLATRLSTVDVNYTVVHRALEATIGVEVLQGVFLGRIIAYTSKMPQKLVLYDSEEADPTTVANFVLELMRPVVCVHVDDVLLISALTGCEQSVLAFNPRINDRAEGSLVITETKLLVKLCWSVMNP